MDASAQTGATPTTTSVPVATPLPTATPTGTTYPDAQTVLGDMGQVVGMLHTTHFQQLADQTGAVALHINMTGDASCTGMKVHISAKATLTGTQQKQTHSLQVIQYKSKFYQKSKSTKHRWKKSSYKTIDKQLFGLPVEGQNPLPCATSSVPSGSGGSAPTDQLKDLVNVGPSTIGGAAVWHIHATDVQIDSQGNSSTLPLDWYIDQKTSLLYQFVLSFSDSTQNVTGQLTTNMSKFGEKFKAKAPKVGSKKP